MPPVAENTSAKPPANRPSRRANRWTASLATGSSSAASSTSGGAFHATVIPRRRDGPSEPHEAGTGQQGLGREPTPGRHQFGPRQAVVWLLGAEADMPGLGVLDPKVAARGDRGRCAEACARVEDEPRAGACDRRPDPY